VSTLAQIEGYINTALQRGGIAAVIHLLTALAVYLDFKTAEAVCI